MILTLLRTSTVGLGFVLAAASLAGCGSGSDGTVDYTLGGVPHSTNATAWRSQQDGHPEMFNVSAWRSRDDSNAVLQVSFPEDPGSYDCTGMDVAAVQSFPSGNPDAPDHSADYRTVGSVCTVTWARDAHGDIVGDFTATLGQLGVKMPTFIDVSGHFDVVGAPPFR